MSEQKHMYFDRVEPCPICGRMPKQFERFWRVRTLICECGKREASIIRWDHGDMPYSELFEHLYNAWNTEIRKELGKRNRKVKLIYFDTLDELNAYHMKKFPKDKPFEEVEE